MVKALHRAGIEVILDVVFNHTAEGDRHAARPSASAGWTNDAYYMLEPDRRRYANYTGCGNTLQRQPPVVRRLILDCLRYWVRADARGRLPLRPGLDPVARRVGPPAAEPARPLGHRVGPGAGRARSSSPRRGTRRGSTRSARFVGDAWPEWNGRFRDDVRRFVRGDDGHGVDAGRPAARQSRTSTATSEREPEQSINFVTCHDGFTLNDLVSYNDKHNEANGEENRDGTDDNLSWNCGVEGPTDDPDVEALRSRQIKNFLAVAAARRRARPMLLVGDEVAPHAARQQQRLLPGQRDQLVRLAPARAQPRPPPLREAPARLSLAARRRWCPTPGPHAQPAPAARPRSPGTASSSAAPTGATTRTRWPSRSRACTAASGCTGCSTRTGSTLRFELPPRRRARLVRLASLDRHVARVAGRRLPLGEGAGRRGVALPRAAALARAARRQEIRDGNRGTAREAQARRRARSGRRHRGDALLEVPSATAAARSSSPGTTTRSTSGISLFDNVVAARAAPARASASRPSRARCATCSRSAGCARSRPTTRENPKRVYYLSMEFLIGRSLANNVTNLLLDPLVRRSSAAAAARLARAARAGAGRRAGQRRPRPPRGLLPRLAGDAADPGHGLRPALRVRHLPADDRERLAARAARQLAAPARPVGGRAAGRAASRSTLDCSFELRGGSLRADPRAARPR